MRRSKVSGLGLWGLIGLLFLGVMLALWLHGRSYYALDPIERVDHAAHASLRASGTLGHLYGIAGTVLMLLNLLYFVRKRARLLRGRGSLRAWMNLHVLAGLGGASLILLHSAFLARNQVARLAAWSLVTLIVTGLAGRYLYGLLPHLPSGDEESESALRLRLGEARRNLGLRIAGRPCARPWMKALPAWSAARTPGPLLALLQLPLLPLGHLRAQRALAGIEDRFGHELGAETPGLLAISRDILRLEQALRSAVVYRNLFLWWRALHRAFAILMVLAMLFHVGVALYYGYRWLG
ncbi:MAG TPA: hypothetical protein VH877_19060 [Polyangia bacterium]|jgi:hypothetical protein|nr:hypothetical protein [Polyangia bacterium]